MQKFYFSVLLLFCGLITFSQDISFSQFFSNPIYLNPSFAGTAGVPRIALQYRDQWHSFSNAFNTYALALDFPLNKIQGGLGFHLLKDSQGNNSFSLSQLDATYSVNLRVSEKSFLLGAVQAGFHQYSLDPGKLVFPDNVDPVYGHHGVSRELEYISDTHFSCVDFATGLLLYSKRYFAGLAIHHLAEPVYSFSQSGDKTGRLDRKYSAHFGARLPVFLYGHQRKKFDISPQLVMQYQGDFGQINYGILATKWGLTAGTWFRQNFGIRYDAVIFLVGFMRKTWQLTYTYDVSVSGLWGDSGGSSEISLVFLFREIDRGRYLPFYNFYEDEFGAD